MIATLLDRLTEVTDVLARNRLRTVLTAGSVAWGIFMLVLLLGFGRGLENNVRWMFRDDAQNSIWIYRGKTTLPYAGYPVGRRLVFDNRDHDAVAATVDGVQEITSRFYPPVSTARWKDRVGRFNFRSVHPDHRYLENTLIATGRFLNDRDLEEKRKVAVIGRKVVEELFRGQDPLGEWLDIGGVMFQVVGTFTDVGGEGEEEQIYLPITTAQGAYQGAGRVDQIMFTIGPEQLDDTASIVAQVRGLLSRAHRFDPNDRRAVRVRDNVEEFVRIQTIFTMLSGFVWLVGLGTVASGIVGVSNILLVSVKERTSEFGLRKALGARPRDIVGMVLTEALLLTGVSGYAGLVAGVATLEGIRRFVPENDYIRDPEVDLATAMAALGVLVVAGCLAGLVPAVRAARLDPIVALREE